MPLRTALLFVFALGSLSWPRSARALAPEPLLAVLALGSEPELAQAQRSAKAVEHALRSAGLPVLSGPELAAKLAVFGSAPQRAAPTLAAEIEAHTRAALEHVAFGRYAASEESARAALAAAERAPEVLAGDPALARRTLDACLARVRAALATAPPDEAVARARDCRRIVPDEAPTPYLHPPPVLARLAEAEAAAARGEGGQLSIHADPGCEAWLQGRPLGPTPVVLRGLAPGHYSVQARCGARVGRVHALVLAGTPVALRPQVALEAALRDGQVPALAYPDAGALAHAAMADAGALGRALAVAGVVLVQSTGRASSVTVLGVANGVLRGPLQIPPARPGAGAADLARALLPLDLAGLVRAPPSAPPSPAHPEEARATLAPLPEPPPQLASIAPPTVVAPEHAEVRRPYRLQRGAALALAAVGIGLFSGGAHFARAQARLQARIDDVPLERGQSAASLHALGSAALRARQLTSLALAGGVLLATAVPLTRLESRGGVAWWSYGLGALGTAALGWSVAEFARDGRCTRHDPSGACLQLSARQGPAMLLLSAALPLVAFPVSHALLAPRRTERAVQVAVQPVAHGSMVSVSGSL